MRLYDFSEIFRQIGFLASFSTNFVLIWITVFHTKKLFGAYKKMIIYFSVLGTSFSGLEMIMKPFTHNYNGALLSFNLCELNISIAIRQIFILIWSGFYLIIVSFISVQFLYRYLCVFNEQKTKYFDGLKSVVWISYPLVIGTIYAVTLFFLCCPDDFTDAYVRKVIFENYAMDVSQLPRYSIVPYAADGSIRPKSIIFLLFAIVLISFSYCIIIFTCVQMHRNMKKELAKFSAQNQKLQYQFFIALVMQTIGPTIFLIIPAGPILMTPLIAPIFELEVNWQTGNLYSLVGFYPPFDSIAFMMIVSEYKTILKSSDTTIGLLRLVLLTEIIRCQMNNNTTVPSSAYAVSTI